MLAAIKTGRLKFADLSAAQRRQVWGAPLVEILIEASQTARIEVHPGEMVELAQFARLAVEKMKSRRCGDAVVADLRARTSAELANAYRVSDNFPAAWEAMSEAIRSQPRGTGDLLLLARVADLTASLLAGQSRFNEAGELIEPLLQLYARLCDQHLVGRALIKKAVFASYAYQGEESLRLAIAGAELIDPKREPMLPAIVLQAILCATVECGRCRQARVLLWRMRAMRLVPNDRESLLRFRWAEAKMYAGMGDDERAERAFLQAREGFSQLGLEGTTAVCGLELAVLWVRQGKRVAAQILIEELIPIFCRLGIARETLACLLLLREV